MVSAITASPARTQNASIGQRESDRTVSNRMRRSSVVNAESPTRSSKGRPVGTRSGCVGLPLQATIDTNSIAAKTRIRKHDYCRPSSRHLQAWDDRTDYADGRFIFFSSARNRGWLRMGSKIGATLM